MQLKQLIPEEFCLRCDVCCRFPQAHTVWAPLFADSEIKYLVEKDILPPLVFTDYQKTKIANNSSNVSAQRINLIKYKDYFICLCFNPPNSKCKIYGNRPFECQLYPFLLTKKGDKFYLTQDKKCPYLDGLEQSQLKEYVNYLKKEFRKEDVVFFLKQNLVLFTEYPAVDLKLLFPIDI